MAEQGGNFITLTERQHSLFSGMARSETKALLTVRALPSDPPDFVEANTTLNGLIDELSTLGLLQDITAQCPRPNVDPVRQFRIMQLTEQGILFFNEPKRSSKPN